MFGISGRYGQVRYSYSRTVWLDWRGWDMDTITRGVDDDLEFSSLADRLLFSTQCRGTANL